MPKQTNFPKSLRRFPENAARELYIYRVVRRRLPRVFYKEFEDRENERRIEHQRVPLQSGRDIEFWFVDIMMFFAQAAAQGVIGNFAYAAVLRAIKGVRKAKQELVSGGVRFEAVVSRKTYNRVRRKEHPVRRGRQTSAPELEEKLEKEYRLMVRLFDEKKKLRSIHDQDED
jgi:hypothetical protein